MVVAGGANTRAVPRGLLKAPRTSAPRTEVAIDANSRAAPCLPREPMASVSAGAERQKGDEHLPATGLAGHARRAAVGDDWLGRHVGATVQGDGKGFREGHSS